MKKIAYILMLASLLLNASTTIAQNLIVVQNGTATRFYTKLDSAVFEAQNGDTIYLPGGSFESITISKELHVFGAGFNQDSSITTSRSVIGGVTLRKGANYGTLTGCYLNVYCYSGCPPFISIGSVDNYAITRCYVNSGISFDSISNNFTINGNILGSYGQGCLYGGSHSIVLKGTNHIVSNNIILGDISSSGNSNMFNNNIFLYSTSWCGTFNNFNDRFYNNVIFGSRGSVSNSISKNNLGGFNDGVDGQNNQGINNYPLNNVDSVFVDFKLASGWSLKSNFHLKANSPYLNGGSDGTDVGIYGGAFPWKEGSIPSNPHFQVVKIAPKTDSNGNLNVQVKVSAQDN